MTLNFNFQVRKMRLFFLASFMCALLSLAGCQRNPLSKFEGIWHLDIDSMIEQIERKNLGATPLAISEIRAKLNVEKPSIEIKGSEVFVRVASASTKLESKIVGENSQGCLQIIIAEKNLMEYCLQDADTIRISKATKTANSVDEIYRRSKS